MRTLPATLFALLGCRATPPPPAPTPAPTPTVASPTAEAPDPAPPARRSSWVPSFVSTTAPRPSHPLNITFDGRVRLLGYDLDATDPVAPGDRVTVTWYWACLAPVERGWRLFTHLDDARMPVETVEHEGEVRARWQPDHWRAGEYVRDEQTFTVPESWRGRLLRVHVGLWRDNERMEPLPREATDGDRRARALELGVRIPALEQTLRVARARGPIRVDGRATDAAWRDATITPLTPDAPPPWSVRLLWDAEALYALFEADDTNVQGGPPGDGDPAASDAVRLLLVDALDAANATELTVTPRGRRVRRSVRADGSSEPLPDDVPWRAAVAVRGTLDRPADRDRGYVVELAVPWRALGLNAPQAGQEWFGNLAAHDADASRWHPWVADRDDEGLRRDWLARVRFE